ncbi:coiled-coil domain-containing protein 96-like [Ctenocephalides felis]|uniref:coiled-coil domain-containing protein 96-like n=1 Tax=Ctenocephalides felis TaxID=7515 RepID=UPI000E6E123B|nr:coiled-coil domain-containing protein 96-like [Ctenocephalides felis]
MRLERTKLRKINLLLQRRISNYVAADKLDQDIRIIRRKRPLGIFTLDKNKLYKDKLQKFGELLTSWKTEHRLMTRRTRALQEDCDNASEHFAKELVVYEKRLREVGVGLIRARNAQPLQEKVVDRYLRRQRLKLHELSAQRLRLLKVLRALKQAEDYWKTFSVIDPSKPKERSIMVYEKLLAMKQHRAEKLEDRKSEIQALDEKCRGIAVALAHVREKAHAVKYDVLYSTEMLQGYEEDAAWIRLLTNSSKMARDRLKREIEKKKMQCGLMLRPDLLKDMMKIVEKVEERKIELEKQKELHQKEHEQLVRIREKIHERSKSRDILREPFKIY